MKAKLYKFLLILSCLLIQVPAAQACQKLVRLSGIRETGMKGFLLGNRDAAIICATIALGAYAVKKLFPAPDQDVEQDLEQDDNASTSSGGDALRASPRSSPKSSSSTSSPSSASSVGLSPQSQASSPLSAVSERAPVIQEQLAVIKSDALQAPIPVPHSPIVLRESHEACLALKEALQDLIAQKDASMAARGDIITCLNTELGKKDKRILRLKKIIDEQNAKLIQLNAKLDERQERDYARGSRVQDW